MAIVGPVDAQPSPVHHSTYVLDKGDAVPQKPSIVVFWHAEGSPPIYIIKSTIQKLPQTSTGKLVLNEGAEFKAQSQTVVTVRV